MATTKSKCHVCAQEIYRNSDGAALAHTTTDGRTERGTPRAVLCPGSTRGARP